MRKLIVICLLGLPLYPAAIQNLTVQNLSTSDYTIDTATQIAEFRSANSGPTAVSTVGNTSTFSSRFAWFLGQRAIQSDPNSAQAFATIGYEISFDILDAANAGYLLIIDVSARGWLTGIYESSDADAGSINVQEGALDATLGINGTFDSYSDLSSFGGSTSADFSNASQFNDLKITNGQLVTGGFGSFTYTLRFSGLASSIMASSLTTGEGAQRYGLNPTLGGFQNSNTPGTDGEEANLLGHSVSVSVVSFEATSGPNEVPEPGSLAAIGAGLFALWLKRR